MTNYPIEAITTAPPDTNEGDIETIIESAVERAVDRVLAGHLVRLLATSEASRTVASLEPGWRSPVTHALSEDVEPSGSGSQAVSVPEAARMLGISRSHAYEMIQLERLCGIHLGRRIVVPLHSIEEMLRTRGSRNHLHG